MDKTLPQLETFVKSSSLVRIRFVEQTQPDYLLGHLIQRQHANIYRYALDHGLAPVLKAPRLCMIDTHWTHQDTPIKQRPCMINRMIILNLNNPG